MESLGSAPADPVSYEGVWRFTAPAVEVSVPQARHAVRDLLGRQGVPIEEDILQGLLLIVSELVTNAVKHAALLSPELAVEVAIGADWVRVSVEDNHPYRPTALETDYAQTARPTRVCCSSRRSPRRRVGTCGRGAHRERRQDQSGRRCR
ncbi:hypothetical protein SMICM304S_09540 [Streptomyces microflavus]